MENWLDYPQVTVPFNQPDKKQFQAAWVYFPKVDSNAVPVLKKALRRKDTKTDMIYRSVFSRLPSPARRVLSNPGQPNNELTRLVAIVVLGRLGADAKPAIPDLIDLLDSDDSEFVRVYAADLLSRFINEDQNAYDALIRASFIELDRPTIARGVPCKLLGARTASRLRTL